MKELIDNLFPDFSEDRKNEISDFLQKQEKENVSEMSPALFIINKVYEKYPDIRLFFSDKIDLIPRQINFSMTNEQINNFLFNGYQYFDKVENVLMTSAIEGIVCVLNENKTNTIITNRKFLEAIQIKNQENAINFSMMVYCKVPTIKEMRKFKLKELNEFFNSE